VVAVSFAVGLRRTSNVYGGFRLTPERITNFAQGLDDLCTRYGVDIHFVSCHDAPAENDHVLHEEIRGRMRMREHARLLEWTADIPALASIFCNARAVIAMRLHAGVLGVAFERPTLLLPYDTKVSEFGVYAGVRHVATDVVLDSAAGIARAFESLMSDTDPPGPPASANRWSEPLPEWLSVHGAAFR
jgi:polysaccharide pyruvyl transferase WcaK-like protein